MAFFHGFHAHHCCPVTTILLALLFYSVASNSSKWDYSNINSELDIDLPSKVRNRREQNSNLKYTQTLSVNVPVLENAPMSTQLFDFNSVTFENNAASYLFRILRNADSIPQSDNIFTVDSNRILRFKNETEKNKFFDYEQFPNVVVIVEVTSDSDSNGMGLYVLYRPRI